MVGVPFSRALLGGFAIGARVSLLRQHTRAYSAEREMSASACTRSMPGFLIVFHITLLYERGQ